MKNDCIKAKKRGSKKGLKGKEKKSKVQKYKRESILKNVVWCNQKGR